MYVNAISQPRISYLFFQSYSKNDRKQQEHEQEKKLKIVFNYIKRLFHRFWKNMEQK